MERSLMGLTGTVMATVVAVAVGLELRRRARRRGAAGRLLEELEVACETEVERLRNVAAAMAAEMENGLRSEEEEEEAKVKMLLTFVDSLPNGNEKGIYYALDVGGTNFRILRVWLGGKRPSLEVQEVDRHHIPEELMKGTGEALFDFLASSIEKFVQKEEKGVDSSSRSRKWELGFTFSFPVKQTSVASGNLIKWTKGFAIKDMVGKEVTGLLQKALDNRGIDMRVAALVNDTVGTLALGHYHDPDTVAAVIIGTGTNACYPEHTGNIRKSRGLATQSGEMVINTEWGNFWSSHLPRTSYDIELDTASLNPNEMLFEKMISGMYLGEMVRRVILRMLQESDEFGPVTSKLSQPFILGTPFITAMHEDSSSELAEVERILKELLEIRDVPLNLRRVVVRVCDAVTRRAGRLAAAGVVGILKKIGRIDGSTRSVVAVEGGLYANYRRFREYLHEALEEILGKDVAGKIELTVTEDGSGLGAALLAAAASHSSNGWLESS